MSVWKQFCRLVESKLCRRHFGDLVSKIDQCALFEFTDEQIHEAQEHRPVDLSSEEDYPIPPFPFPQMCMIGSAGCIVLESPVMDEETGILEFEMMVFVPEVSGEFFQTATCIVDSTTLNEKGEFPMKLQGIRGIWKGAYWDEEHPFSVTSDYGMNPDAMEEERRQYRKRVEEGLVTAKKKGDQRLIQECEAALVHINEADAEAAEMIEHARELHEEVRLLEQRARETQLREAREAFYLGLQEVNWINFPEHFMIEVAAEQPPSKKRKPKEPRVRRLNERARHIILKKNDITKRWHKAHQGGTHAPPIPHLRRGHYKTLRAERFKEKRGKRIWVRASHVGGECVEWRDGDVLYKVL